MLFVNERRLAEKIVDVHEDRQRAAQMERDLQALRNRTSNKDFNRQGSKMLGGTRVFCFVSGFVLNLSGVLFIHHVGRNLTPTIRSAMTRWSVYGVIAMYVACAVMVAVIAAMYPFFN